MAKALVRDPDALRRLRAALIEFCDECAGASSEADAQIGRMTQWLTREQPARWKHEVRRREDLLGRTKSEFHRKRGQGVGTPPTAMEERKAVERAMRSVEAAQQVLRSLNALGRELERAASQYRGRAQRLNSIAQRDLPMGVAAIDGMLDALEKYLYDAPPESAAAIGPVETDAGRSVSRSRSSPHAEETIGWPALRQRTCSDEERFGVPSGSLEPTDEKAEQELGSGLGEALAALSHQPCEAGDRLIATQGVGCSGRWYLERTRTGLPGDSGWFLGSSAEPLGEPVGADEPVFAMPVGDLLSAMPWLDRVMGLAPGALVVLDGTDIIAIVDENDRIVFVRGTPEIGSDE